MGAMLEVCCGSAGDAIAAWQGGATRVELNSDLFHGGLTPSLGSLRTVKRHAPGLRVMCMVRPREGGFCYTGTEFETMLEDAALFLENGADGIVFGVLLADGRVDVPRCRRMMEVIGGHEAVFHRAVDVTPDWRQALDALMELGITRVLTSGQRPTVPEGAMTIRAMGEYCAGRMEVLPGGGVTAENAAWCRRTIGCEWLHAAMHRTEYDRSCGGNPAIYFGGAVYPPEDRFSLTHAEDVAAFIGSGA